MKYTKPHWNHFIAIPDSVADFLDSLPAEFEIVQPGMTQVRWPEGCTRAALESDAKYIYYRLDTESSTKVGVHLKALAAIAPVEKKRRKVELWRSSAGDWHVSDPDDFMLGMEWRKVGECEVTE